MNHPTTHIWRFSNRSSILHTLWTDIYVFYIRTIAHEPPYQNSQLSVGNPGSVLSIHEPLYEMRC